MIHLGRLYQLLQQIGAKNLNDFASLKGDDLGATVDLSVTTALQPLAEYQPFSIESN